MARTVAELAPGERGVLATLDVPAHQARRLMEHGFLPGATVHAVCAAPGGDPCVFRVDGADVALRLETARRLHLLESP